MRQAEVEARIAGPNDQTVDLPVSYSLRDEAFVGSFRPGAAGDYRVEATANEQDRVLGEDSAHFSARAVDPELASPLANLDLLRNMADATSGFGGRYYPYRTGAELFNHLEESAEPVMVVQSQHQPLWDFWPMFAAMFGCLVIEWAIRKRKGLI
jgi:hypothetical protein